MIEIGDGIFVETGFDGVNVGAILTREGIVCIDAPSYPRDARDWVIQLERVHARPIRLLILTDCHGDRILNTRWFHTPILSQRSVAEQLNSYEKRYPQYLLDSLYRRSPTRSRELPQSPVQRPSLSFTNGLSLLFPPYSINLSHWPGPTAANTWITIPEEGILFVGDSVVSGTMPIFAEMRWHDWMVSLNHLESSRDSYKVVVPGRGDIGNVNAYRDMITYLQTIERTVLNHAEEGLSLADLTNKAHDLMSTFPTDTLPVDWMTNEITRGLERAYEQLVVEDRNRVVVPADREPN
ncbi:MAG TPA: MBL fold metallo-hydrolase [Patescibacteria group bacterium]|nr:MBL fold metallo-hydrolase [Patescibacteria group bacterium]